MSAFPPTPPDDLDDPAVIREHDWQAFRSLTHMANHWERPGWTDGRRSYHWLVDLSQPEAVRQLATECQGQLDVFDLVPLDSLHVTLGRVGFTDEITKPEALAVAKEAAPRCAAFAQFKLSVGPLAGSRGALRFTVAPWTPLMALYDELATATSTVLGERAVMDSRYFRPHLSIAYSHTEVPLASLLPTIGQLRKLPSVAVDVRAVVFVELLREGRTYRYEEIHRGPLG